MLAVNAPGLVACLLSDLLSTIPRGAKEIEWIEKAGLITLGTYRPNYKTRATVFGERDRPTASFTVRFLSCNFVVLKRRRAVFSNKEPADRERWRFVHGLFPIEFRYDKGPVRKRAYRLTSARAAASAFSRRNWRKETFDFPSLRESEVGEVPYLIQAILNLTDC